MAAITKRLLRLRRYPDPLLRSHVYPIHGHFSTSSDPSPGPETEPERQSSYFKDVKDSLRRESPPNMRPQMQPKPFSFSNSTPLQSPTNSSNPTTPSKHLSSATGCEFSFKDLRECLPQFQVTATSERRQNDSSGKAMDPMSFARFTESLKLKPAEMNAPQNISCILTKMMKRETSAIDGHDDFTMETQSSIRLSDTSRRENSEGGYHKKQLESLMNYDSWNREMDNHLAKVLTDQMAQGNKCDGGTWKPQALQAAVTYLNSTLHLNLSKENIKNRLKAWKKYYSFVTDVQKQSGFSWNEE